MEADHTGFVANFASLGFTAWLAWYLIVHAIPRLTERHAQERAEDRAEQARLRAEDRKEFLAALDRNILTLQAMQDKFDAAVREQRAECKRELELILSILQAPRPHLATPDE